MTQMHEPPFTIFFTIILIPFLRYIKYLTYNDTTYIVKNDEDGLNDLFER